MPRSTFRFCLVRGQLLMLANESTQSATGGFVRTPQAHSGIRAVGSTMAGASGNQTFSGLPGHLTVYSSGVVVECPHGPPTQRRGVRIDGPVRPTAAGLAAGRDEVLEKALSLVGH